MGDSHPFPVIVNILSELIHCSQICLFFEKRSSLYDRYVFIVQGTIQAYMLQISAEKAIDGLERKTGYVKAFADSVKEVEIRTRIYVDGNRK